MEYEIVIGLEIHSQLNTNTKIFCSCKNKFGAKANTHGCPVCLGLPGALPVLNRSVAEMAIRAGLATGCTIRNNSIFARKNYFYPDLPKGYQITQYDKPICENGSIKIKVDGIEKVIGITRIHLEEDAGKLIHDQDIDTLFDVNRCGTPLIEIVSEPDLRSPKEAYIYLAELKRILKYLEISDCNMEEGSLRCDANISLRPFGQNGLGTKTELKNMNSFRNVEKALEYEYLRQKDLLESGVEITQQTYLWDANKNITLPMRSKENAQDYRYFPEPDLAPIVVTNAWIDKIKASLPELPQAKEKRICNDFSLSSEHAHVLTDNKLVADFFEATVAVCGDAKLSANWIMGEVFHLLHENNGKIEIQNLKITPQKLGDIIIAVKVNLISAKAAKKVFNKIGKMGGDPYMLIQEMGLGQISNSDELRSVVQTIIDVNPAEVERFKAGDKKLAAFFVGQAMRTTKGKGNPKEINRIFSELLR